jgi:hypothetical protein
MCSVLLGGWLLVGATADWPRAAGAQQSYPKFLAFLIDLEGWTGLERVGTEEERKGGRVINALRSYVRGDAHFYAQIALGIAGDSGAGVHIADSGSIVLGGVRITVNRSRVHESTSTIDGFEVRTLSTPAFVLIAVTLRPDAAFSLIFNQVSEDEAMAIAQKFDWKRMRAELN